MLDEYRNDHLRILFRRIRNEPGVVALHEWQSGGAEPSTLRDHLRRSGFAGDVQARHPCVSAGAAFFVHHFPQAVSDRLQRAGGDPQSANDFAGHLQAFDAAVGLCPLDHPHDMRPIHGPAVRYRSHHDRALKRSDDQGSLADGDGYRFAGIPLSMLLLRRPIRRWDDARLFAIEVNLRNLSQTEVMSPFGDLVDAQSRADVVEENVAGNFQSVRHGDHTVTLPAPVTEASTKEHRAARAIERRSRTDRPLRQSSHCHDRFENRTGRIETLNRAIELDFEWIRRDQLPRIGRESFRVNVRIEFWRGNHRQDLAVARIDGHDGADEFIFGEVLLRAALQVEIDGQIDVVSRLRLLSRRSHFGEPASVAVVLPELRAVLAAQIFVVHQLDAAFADQVTLFEVFMLGEIFFVHLADEADDVRGHRSVRIIAPLHRLDVELRERQ